MPLPADGGNVKLGKGSLLLAPIVGGVLGPLRFKGNASAITLSAEVTKAQLYSSTQRSAPLIAENVTRVGYGLAVTLNEYTLDNLRQFLLGSAATRSQLVGVNVVKAFDGDVVEKSAYLDLEAREVSNVTLTYDGTNVAVEDTDYVVYEDSGLILITKNGAIPDGVDISVEFDRPALTIDQVQIATDGAPVCKLIYQADDANTDGVAHRDRLTIWKVSVAPEGDLNVISDEYGSFQLSLGVISDAANHPTDPFGTLERIRV